MDAKKIELLAAMGIDVWRVKDGNDGKNKNDGSGIAFTSNKDVTSNENVIPTWEDLENRLHACALCKLSKTRTNIVFGAGNRNTDVMLIGEAPGENEDLQGEPFVGRAGLLLNEMLRSIGLERKDVYIANILKCRPPSNRDPLPHEIELCTPYLMQQIALVQPKIIVAVGRVAAQFLLNTAESMGKLRGKIHKYGEKQIPLFVIYHPAYLLRSPSDKSKAYTDMLNIRKFLHRT